MRAARLALAGFALLAACSRKDAAPVGRTAPSASSAAEKPAPSLERSVEALGLHLLRALNEDTSSGSFVVSPVSVASSVAMIGHGARGATQGEADAALHHPPRRAPSDFIALASSGPFKRTDHAFVDDGLTVAPAFAAEVGKALTSAPLRKTPRDAAKAINRIVGEASQGAFPSLVPENQLDPRSRVVLTSTFEVSAPWQEPLNSATTSDEWFHPIGGADVRIPTMRSALGQQRRVVTDTYEAVELTIDPVHALLLVAPKQDFHAFTKSLDPSAFDAIVEGLKQGNVSLKMPRFTIETKRQLRPELEKLGVRQAFLPSADLTGIAPSDVVVNDVFHASKIVVDEHGIGAKVPREWNMPRMAQTVGVTLDRPFLFFLRSRRTGMLFLTGRWMGPG